MTTLRGRRQPGVKTGVKCFASGHLATAPAGSHITADLRPGAYGASMTAPRAPGLLLGIGLGGFLDGILLHQIFQWHNMLSAVDPPTSMPAMRRNMRADGLFHLATWLSTCAGVVALWSAGPGGRAPVEGRAFAGDLLLGWGLFNLVEGLIDHHLLGR